MIQILVSLATFCAAAASITGLGSSILPGGLLSRRFAAGAIGLYLVLALAGWLGLYSSALLWAVLLFCLGLFFLKARDLRLPKTVLWLAGGLVVLLPLALLPPFSRDAMNHHLFLPRMWLETGGIVRPGWASFFSYPYLTETFYTLTGGTFGFAGARMISLLGLSFAGIALLEAAPKKGTVKVLAVLVLLSIPELLRNATWAYSDTFMVFFSLMVFLEFLREDGTALHAAVWASAAAMCKYNGLLVLAATLVLLPLRFGFSWKRILLPAGAAILLCLPWLLPNLVQWGNPVYPLLGGVFGGGEALSARASGLITDAGVLTSTGSGVLDYLLLPVRMSVSGRWDDPRLYDGASGPLLLAGSVLFLLLCRRRREYLLLPVLYLLAAVLLSGTGIRTRYMLPGLVMLVLPAALGLDAVTARMRSWVTVALVGVCLVWTGARVLDLYEMNRPWTVGRQDGYLANTLEYFPFYMEAEKVLDVDDLTLFVNMGNRAFYFPSRVVFDEHRFPFRILESLWEGSTAGELTAELKSEGVTHVAMHMGYSCINIPWELSADQLSEWREFTARGLRPVISMNPYVLFEVI
jgi:hypothetical protein